MKLLLFILLGLTLSMTFPLNPNSLDDSDFVELFDDKVNVDHVTRLLQASSAEEQTFEEEAPLDLLPEIRSNPLLLQLLQFGATQVVVSGIRRGKIHGDRFRVTSVSDWSEQGTGNQKLFSFTCVIISLDEKVVIDTTFTVHYDTATMAKRLGAYDSTITTTVVVPARPVAPGGGGNLKPITTTMTTTSSSGNMP